MKKGKERFVLRSFVLNLWKISGSPVVKKKSSPDGEERGRVFAKEGAGSQVFIPAKIFSIALEMNG
jgi:hypothetical protein